MAQCVWDDGMAESIVRNYTGSKMIILAGNGHIYRKFGIPERAYRRTNLPYQTVYLAAIGTKADLSDGDYIWVTESATRPKRRR